MQTPRKTRGSSSVLGKRAHQAEHVARAEQLPTPDITPANKRVKTSVTELDGDHNKENIAPLLIEALNSDISPSSRRRSLNRSTTDTTPSRRRSTAISRARSSSVSSVEVSQLRLATPPPSPPVTQQSLHVRARALIRATCNSKVEMPGRDVERGAIRKFISSFINGDDDEHSSIYISGSPGTGKTALVHSVLDSMADEMDGVQVIFMNCMALSNIDSLHAQVLEQLSSVSKTRGKPKRQTLTTVLTNLKTRCVLVLDELDNLTRTQQSLAALLSLSTTNSSFLRVVGIANTHTLTSSSSPTVTSEHVQTVHFAPYTSSQLLDILKSRLQTLSAAEGDDVVKQFLPLPAMTLLTKKIAGMTGDVRCLFEVLRGAIDLAHTAAVASGNAASIKVLPGHILSSLKTYTPPSNAPSSAVAATPTTTNSEIVSKVQSLGLQARLVMLCVVLASQRVGASLSLGASGSPVKRSISAPAIPSSSNSKVQSMESAQLFSYYTAVLSRAETGIFSPVSRSTFGDLVGMLEGVGLVNVSSSTASPTKTAKRTFSRSASFGCGANKGSSSGDVRLAAGVWAEEVLRGLGASAGTAADDMDVKEEEVRGIWEMEQARIAREIKAALPKAKNPAVDAFGDAMED